MTEHVARPVVIDVLAAEFERAVERDARRRRRLPRPGLVALAGAVLVAATAYASGLLPVGEPLEGPPPGDVPARLLPKPGTTRVDSVRVPDPQGGPAWGLRLATSAAGAACYSFGRVQGGQLGVVDATGSFRAIPAAGTGTCVDLAVEPVGFDVRRLRAAAGGTRTLVGGLASRDIVRIVVSAAGSTRTVAPTRAGGFLAVFAGRIPLSSLGLEARFRDGTSRTLLGGTGR